MRNYIYRNINETYLCNGRQIEHFNYVKKLICETDKTMLANFNKVSKWIHENCPHLTGVFRCRHDVYHWTALVVEDGKAYLEHGSHGHAFSTALSETETAVFSRGSMQERPYAFEGTQFFHNARLEEFLKQWPEIKEMVIEENKKQSRVYSETFEA